MKPRAITLLAGLSLMIPATFAISGGPTLLTPLPGLVVIPTFLLGVPAVFLPSLLFFLCNPGLFSGEENLPKRTVWVFIASVGLTPIWFVLGWKFGLQYQGPKYTYAVCAINGVWILALATLFVICQMRRATFAWNVMLHWLVLLWLAWFAFPYLGELP
jgi:hypothetical protein